MYVRVSVIVAALLLQIGCSGSPKRQLDPSAFASVRTIELSDATNPVLLASTGAKQINEYLEIGLKNRGYAICRACSADAVATAVVSEYSTKQTSKRDWVGWGNLNYITTAETHWTLTIVRNGVVLFQTEVEDEKAMSIEQLAGQQVQEVMQKIPVRQ